MPPVYGHHIKFYTTVRYDLPWDPILDVIAIEQVRSEHNKKVIRRYIENGQVVVEIENVYRCVDKLIDRPDEIIGT